MSDQANLEGGLRSLGLQGAQSPFVSHTQKGGQYNQQKLMGELEKLASQLVKLKTVNTSNRATVLQEPGSGPKGVTVVGGKCPVEWAECNPKEVSVYGVVCPVNAMGSVGMVLESGNVCVPEGAMEPIKKLMDGRRVNEVLSEISMKLHNLIEEARMQGLNAQGFLDVVSQNFEARQQYRKLARTNKAKTNQAYDKLAERYAALSGGSSFDEVLSGGGMDHGAVMGRYSDMAGGADGPSLAGGELSAGHVSVDEQPAVDDQDLESLIAEMEASQV
jgi:hypothetical protein